MTFPFIVLFIITLISGSFVAISASSWFIAWLGLEMNLLSFLPLMNNEKTKNSSEACMKYFLTQSMASLIILMASVFILSSVLFSNMFVIFVGLSIKLGVAPFHYWFPMVMEGVNWMMCLVLMSWQKLAPLFLMSFLDMVLEMIVITALVGCFGGFGQFSIKKILAFSSIGHVGWMMAGMSWGFIVGLYYFMIYFMLTFLIILSLVLLNLSVVKDFSVIPNVLKMMMLVNFLSLGGMPPFLGFFPKWLVIDKLIWSSYFLALVLILSSLISLYFYSRMIYSSFLINNFSGEVHLGVTFYGLLIVAFFFLSSGGVFCYPLLSSI